MTRAALLSLFKEVLGFIPSSAYLSVARALRALVMGNEEKAAKHIRAATARTAAKAVVHAPLRNTKL